MKKVSQIIASTITMGMAVVLAACSGGKSGGSGGGYEFEMWTGFGKDYTTAIEGVIDVFNNAHRGKIKVSHVQKSSYPSLRNEVLGAKSQKKYPNIVNGYPDHFADYNEEKFIINLNPYIERYNKEHKSELQAKGYNSIIDDYYEEYMTENLNIASGKTLGVPFNKSTEILVANGYYLDFFQEKDSTIAVPTTWDELATVNTKVQAIVNDPILNMKGENSKFIYGEEYEVEENGKRVKHVHNCVISDSETVPSGKVLVQDIQNLTTAKDFWTLGYDSPENAFITLLHQWNVPYTSNEGGVGKALFWQTENKAATRGVVEYFDNLYKANAFAVPATFDKTYNFCTTALEHGRVLFTVGSSGGLSKPKFSGRRLDIHPIPYHDAAHKCVISQGTSLGVLNRTTAKDQASYDEEMYNAFTAVVELTTGSLQANWVTQTGYFPASKSAYNDPKYQELLNNNNPSRLEILYRDAGTVNSSTYTSTNGWEKFVDPGFAGSNSIRVAVQTVFHNVFSRTGSTTIDKVIDAAWADVDGKLKN